MKVKKIRWTKMKKHKGWWIGKVDTIAVCSVVIDEGGKRWWRKMNLGMELGKTPKPGWLHGSHKTVDLAKAKAQRVFEEFVMSCLRRG